MSYTNDMTDYGTGRDSFEWYTHVSSLTPQPDFLTQIYEDSGLFAKIIDMPSEDATSRGFEIVGLSDAAAVDWYTDTLDRLEWVDTAATAMKWARLYGGSLIIMLIDDGGRQEDPLNMQHIRSIDALRVFDGSISYPVYTGGDQPSHFRVYSKYGEFLAHESRCLIFQNGRAPENSRHTDFWGFPEYIRIDQALRDVETTHAAALKILDRAVQAVYSMKGLTAALSSEQGESRLMKRLEAIDAARNLISTSLIDADNEDFDFRTFQLSGLNEAVNVTCEMLSAVTGIPLIQLFGKPIQGGNAYTDKTSMEVYYNAVERIQQQMLKGNLNRLLDVVFRAGLADGAIDDLPPQRIRFSPLWSTSELEQADIEHKRVRTQYARAKAAEAYNNMRAISSAEVRHSFTPYRTARNRRE